MKSESVLIQRRTFLKTGAAGGLIAAAIPLSQLAAGFPITADLRDWDRRKDEEPYGELRKIVRRHGGEFGEVGKEY